MRTAVAKHEPEPELDPPFSTPGVAATPTTPGAAAYLRELRARIRTLGAT